MSNGKKRVFDGKFKERAVALARERGNVAQAARELEISGSLLRSWIAAAQTAEVRGKGLAGALEEKLEMERLRKRLAEAEEELEIIKKRRRISHERGSGEIRLDRKMKAFHSIELMCRVLKVSRSGFYEWRGRPTRIKVERSDLRLQIQRVFRDSRKTYGHRSVRDALLKDGLRAGRKLVLRLMTEMAMIPAPWKPSPYSILKKASASKVCEHVLQRDFSPPGLNRVWTSDITYIWTRSGWSYLAIVLDLYSRKVIGWSVSDKPDTALVIAALSQALVTRSYTRGQLLFHSDQGCQYTSQELCLFLRERGIIQSMSRRGQCWDNAPTESFFRTLKMETGVAKTHLAGPAEVESVLIDWIETWYNRSRRHTFIGYCSPAEYEARWAA